MASHPSALIALLLLASAFVGHAPADEPKKLPPPPRPLPASAREISIEETDKLLSTRKDTSVIDVRTAQEYSELGHIHGALLVDFMRTDFEDGVKSLKLDPAKPCVIYCAIGGRARRAVATLEKLGFKEIYLPAGSFNAWKKAGKPFDGGRK